MAKNTNHGTGNTTAGKQSRSDGHKDAPRLCDLVKEKFLVGHPTLDIRP